MGFTLSSIAAHRPHEQTTATTRKYGMKIFSVLPQKKTARYKYNKAISKIIYNIINAFYLYTRRHQHIYTIFGMVDYVNDATVRFLRSKKIRKTVGVSIHEYCVDGLNLLLFGWSAIQ